MSNIVVKTEVQKIVVKNADGRDGKSAFQQAVEGGYTGTEQEFNCSLSLLADVAEVKKQISDAINYKGGEANPNEAFTELAEDIKEIPNFQTTGFEYISEIYRPKTLMEAYNNRYYLKSVINNFIDEISGFYTFSECTFLQNVTFPNLVTISGVYTFRECTSLQNVTFPNLVTISVDSTFYRCTSLKNVTFPNLVTISGFYTFRECTSLQNVTFPNLVTISGNSTFNGCTLLKTITLGILIICVEPFGGPKPNIRNITIGKDTDINLPFQYWTATNVINEGQSGIDELNNNLRNNLLEKLADHSQDGQTRTLRIGWLANVSQENIDYANSKGWTLTT
jgi:hypothetical protein